MSGHDAPSRSAFVLRRGLFGYRRREVLRALEEQRRQIEALAASVDRLWREKERAWHANHAASRELLAQRSRHHAQLAVERTRAVAAEAESRATAAVAFGELNAKLDRLLELRERVTRLEAAGEARPAGRRAEIEILGLPADELEPALGRGLRG